MASPGGVQRLVGGRTFAGRTATAGVATDVSRVHLLTKCPGLADVVHAAGTISLDTIEVRSWSISRREPINVTVPLVVTTHKAVGRHAARRSLSVLRSACPEMLVGEQELPGWHALVCGVELHGLPRSWPVLDDCVDSRSRHTPTPPSPADPEERSSLTLSAYIAGRRGCTSVSLPERRPRWVDRCRTEPASPQEDA